MKIYQTKKDLVQGLISPRDTVLDVGFWGQGTGIDQAHWVHRLLMNRAASVWGLDLEFDQGALPDNGQYRKANAETFSIDKKFDVILGADIIEHLSNPGLFLDSAKRHLAPGGKLVLTTPNAFNLYNIAEKLTKDEPTVNRDHTCYFNKKTIRQLLMKNGWQVQEFDYLYSLGVVYKESLRKKFLNLLCRASGIVTPKFMETLVIVATPK